MAKKAKVQEDVVDESPEFVIDRTISVKIQGGPSDGESITVDLMWLNMLIQELNEDTVVCQKMRGHEVMQKYPNHPPCIPNEIYCVPQAEYYAEMGRRIAKSVDIQYCSPSIAMYLRKKVLEMDEVAKKNTDDS